MDLNIELGTMETEREIRQRLDIGRKNARLKALKFEVKVLKEENIELAGEVQRLQADRADLEEEVARIRASGAKVDKMPAVINEDFEQAVEKMQKTVQDWGRFEKIVADMSTHSVGRTYKVERRSEKQIEFMRQGCKRILVVMPSINSVAQWSVNGSPARGMAEAIDMSRSRNRR